MGCATSQSFPQVLPKDGREKPEHPQRDSFGSHPTASSGSRKLDTREAGDGLAALHGSVSACSKVPVTTDRGKALQALKVDGLLLEHMQELCDDREAVLLAVQSNGYAMEFASPQLQSNRDFVAQAVHRNGWALQFVADELRMDKEVALQAIEQTASVMSVMEDGFHGDAEFVRQAVRSNGLALLFAGRYRGNREIVREAILQNQFALIFATRDVREDDDFLLQCVAANGRILQYASRRQRNDRELVLQAVASDPSAMGFASQELRNDKGFALEALRLNGEALWHLPDDFQEDREVVLEAVRQNGTAIQAATPELRADRELVLEALQSNPGAIYFADEKLRKDPEFALEAMRVNRKALGFMPEELRSRPELIALQRLGSGESLDSSGAWVSGGPSTAATGHSAAKLRRSSSQLSARNSLPESDKSQSDTATKRASVQSRRPTLKNLVDAERKASSTGTTTAPPMEGETSSTERSTQVSARYGTRSHSGTLSGKADTLNKSRSNLSLDGHYAPTRRYGLIPRAMSGSMSTASTSATHPAPAGVGSAPTSP
mmetsp:Transcript_400/g.1374  ORF Transcript_400/g.1374 Transcript_400/m.1374 type:complete len:549 (-) Transcript_400:55-1701(-)